MEVTVIAKEDIRYGDIFFPKDSVLIETCDFEKWCLLSELQFAKLASEIKSDEDIFNLDIPKKYEIGIPCEECKFSEVPWFNKVYKIKRCDQRITKEKELADKYWKVYAEKLRQAKEKHKQELDIYHKKLKILINKIVFPNEIKVYLYATDEAIHVDIYRFDEKFLMLQVYIYDSKSMKKQYNNICKLLKRL